MYTYTAIEFSAVLHWGKQRGSVADVGRRTKSTGLIMNKLVFRLMD